MVMSAFPQADIAMSLFFERRVYLLAGVADFLDGLANSVGTHSVLSGDVVDLVRLARRNASAVPFTSIALAISHRDCPFVVCHRGKLTNSGIADELASGPIPPGV